jgi:hypothetical protein
MRFAVAALCVLALTGSASARMLSVPGDSVCGQLPKHMAHPSVTYSVANLDQKALNFACSGDKNATPPFVACTYPVNKDHWSVLVLNSLPLDEVACAVHYEEAHMPPNYWGDPKMETDSTMQWLAEQRTRHRTSP